MGSIPRLMRATSQFQNAKQIHRKAAITRNEIMSGESQANWTLASSNAATRKMMAPSRIAAPIRSVLRKKSDLVDQTIFLSGTGSQ